MKPLAIFPVVALLDHIGPPTVAWLVVSIVVYPFYGILLAWPFSNVRKEVFEILPSLTNRYSSPPISWICLAGFIFASVSYRPPRFVGKVASPGSSVGFSAIHRKTSTAFGSPGSEAVGLDFPDYAAGTLAFPVAFPVFYFRKAHYGPSSENHSRNVSSYRHKAPLPVRSNIDNTAVVNG